MPENPDKLADKLGVNAPNSQVNIENMFVGSSSDDPTKQQDAPIDWQKICRDMLVEREQLTSNRLMVSPDMHKTLDLFVDLALVQQKKADKRDEDVLPEYGSKLYEPSRYSESERFEFNRFLEDVLGAQKNEKLTIVGEPGCGKTTLLQKIAFWLLDNTEDLVLWVSLGELKDKSLRDYLTEDWLQDAVMYADPRILEDWERQFLQRRVWLLLDGLDEMTPETRDALSLKGWVSQARVIVTCRLNVWQTNPRIINGFQDYRMLEFRLSQIEEFIEKWFSQDKKMGEHLHHALNQSGKERIRDLVRNPLRLTLLCSTWHLREGQLPDTRAELYEQFVDDLYDWKQKRFPISSLQRSELNDKLGELAREAIDKESTRFRLRHELVCQILGELDKPQSMLKLALDLGWINAVGVDPQNPRKPVYSFFHATLQEYFAAKNIESWSFFVPPEHEDCPVMEEHTSKQANNYRTFQPQWREVILLWLGRKDIKQEEKEDFLDFLLNFEDGCRGFYFYKAYFLAALGISEIHNHPSAPEIFDTVIRWGFGTLGDEEKQWITFRASLEKQARITLFEMNPSLVKPKLVALLKEVQDIPEVCQEVADFIGKIDFGNTVAVSSLVFLLDSVQEERLYLKVAKSLIQLDPGNVDAEKAFIQISRTSESEWVRRDAALELLKIESSRSIGIKTLISLLCTSKANSILWNLELEEIGWDNSWNITGTIFRAAYSNPNSESRKTALGYLGRLILEKDKGSENLLEVMKVPKRILGWFQLSDTYNLKGLDLIRYVINSLDLLHFEDNKNERRRIFIELLRFGLNYPSFSRLMLELVLESEGPEAKKQAILKIFNFLDADISSLDSFIVELVNSIKDWGFRSFFLKTLALNGFLEGENWRLLITELLKIYTDFCLKNNDPEKNNVRRRLAESLSQIDPKNEEMLSTFLDLLHGDDFITARWVAEHLGGLVNQNQSIVNILLEIFCGSDDSDLNSFLLASVLGDSLQLVFQTDSLKVLVTELKFILKEENKDLSTRYLYGDVFNVIWHCASRLDYFEFYNVWNSEHGISFAEN